jgi:uncharacterized protein (DUF2267 family)
MMPNGSASFPKNCEPVRPVHDFGIRSAPETAVTNVIEALAQIERRALAPLRCRQQWPGRGKSQIHGFSRVETHRPFSFSFHGKPLAVATAKWMRIGAVAGKELRMSTGLSAFDHSVQTTHVRLNELIELLGWQADRRHAYLAPRSVLHALRDQLSVDSAPSLAAQLPMLIRGSYFEGWHPHGNPLKERKLGEFLDHVRADLRQISDVDAERVARAVFQLLAKHVTVGETTKLIHSMPDELRSLWPEEADAS